MWPRIVNTVIGVWLLAAPDVLSYTGAQATNDRIVGPVAVTVALVAIWSVTRSLRWINVALGIWLLVVPWLLDAGTTATLNSVLCGVVLAGCALLPGPSGARTGGGWRAVLHPPVDEGSHASVR